ncbi:MAG: DDE-type integrase/transposase/recombinase, partial [Pseudomonadota bacterium]
DQCGQLIDFRLTARRNVNAARAFMRQASDTVRCYHSLTIVTDKAHSYAKVVAEWNPRSGLEDAIRHITRRHLNNRIEGDHAVLKHRLSPMRGLQSLSTAKAALKGVETFRAIRNRNFAGCERGVANEIAFVRNLLSEAKQAA